MGSGPLTFKQTDLARALRAAKAADVGPFHVRIERGTGDILILPGAPVPAQGAPPPEPETEDEALDQELEAWREQQRA